MYITMAEFLEDAAKDDQVRVALWHATGDSLCLWKRSRGLHEEPASISAKSAVAIDRLSGGS
jgi:hypothetical protein